MGEAGYHTKRLLPAHRTRPYRNHPFHHYKLNYNRATGVPMTGFDHNSTFHTAEDLSPKMSFVTGLSDRDLLRIRVQELLVQRRCTMIRDWVDDPVNQDKIRSSPSHLAEIFCQIPVEAAEAAGKFHEISPDEQESLDEAMDDISQKIRDNIDSVGRDSTSTTFSDSELEQFALSKARKLIEPPSEASLDTDPIPEEMTELLSAMGSDFEKLFLAIADEQRKVAHLMKEKKERVVETLTEIAEQHGFDFLIDPQVEREVTRALFKTEDNYLAQMDSLEMIGSAMRRGIEKFSQQTEDPMMKTMLPMLTMVMEQQRMSMDSAMGAIDNELLLLDAKRLFQAP